ncbi:unnamed protein product [Arabidopsis halleri]
MDWRIGGEIRGLGGEVRALLGRLAVVFDGWLNYAIVTGAKTSLFHQLTCP